VLHIEELAIASMDFFKDARGLLAIGTAFRGRSFFHPAAIGADLVHGSAVSHNMGQGELIETGVTLLGVPGGGEGPDGSAIFLRPGLPNEFRVGHFVDKGFFLEGIVKVFFGGANLFQVREVVPGVHRLGARYRPKQSGNLRIAVLIGTLGKCQQAKMGLGFPDESSFQVFSGLLGQ
jgi:hypothetical protein